MKPFLNDGQNNSHKRRNRYLLGGTLTALIFVSLGLVGVKLVQ